jgi:hypothetical protein
LSDQSSAWVADAVASLRGVVAMRVRAGFRALSARFLLGDESPVERIGVAGEGVVDLEHHEPALVVPERDQGGAFRSSFSLTVMVTTSSRSVRLPSHSARGAGTPFSPPHLRLGSP